MKINFGIELKAINGQPLLDADKEEATVVTLGVIATNALLIPEQKDDIAKKAKKYKLALQTVEDKEVELEVEDIALIKECIGKNYAALVVGQTFDLIEGKF